jgi:hypothetical protein
MAMKRSLIPATILTAATRAGLRAPSWYVGQLNQPSTRPAATLEQIVAGASGCTESVAEGSSSHIEHILGTSVQDIDPLDGNGIVDNGLAVLSGCCNKIFVVEKDIISYGASIWIMRPPDFELSCPYCGTRCPIKATGSRLRDTRPSR